MIQLMLQLNFIIDGYLPGTARNNLERQRSIPNRLIAPFPFFLKMTA